MLRQRYERLVDIALTAQNLFDDFATLLERAQVRAGWLAGWVLLAHHHFDLSRLQLHTYRNPMYGTQAV